MTRDINEARLWFINRIAETLSDLADDDEDLDTDPEDLFDQFKIVAEVLIEAVNLEVTGHDGKLATATFGDN